MSVTIRLRQSGLSSLATNGTLAQQRLSGASNRAYWLKTALVYAGWVVYYSCDGVTISNSDLWTTAGFQAILLSPNTGTGLTTNTVDSIWCCLSSPTTDANGDYLHICLSPSQMQWANHETKGITTGGTTYGIYGIAGNNAQWLSGTYNGFLRLGMALSPSTTAFANGVAYSSTTLLSACGTLPSATNNIWTTHCMGCGTAGTSSLECITVLTDGNQFHVIEDTGTYNKNDRYWWSLCAMDNGGYAVVEQGVLHGEMTRPFGTSLVGGYVYANTNNLYRFNMPTQLGGWRSAYIKRAVDNSIWTGGLECPEPKGWESVVDQPYYDSLITTPNVIKLRAVSCSSLEHYDMGNISEFVMMGNTLINDADVIASGGKSWLSMKDAKAYLLAWDVTDTPSARVTKP